MAKAVLEIRSLARVHSRLAIRVLKEIAREKTAPHSSRVAAASELLDRGWGRPDQHVEITAKSADAMTDDELNAELERIGRLIDAKPLLIEDLSEGELDATQTEHTD